jgi:hypothetical protein
MVRRGLFALMLVALAGCGKATANKAAASGPPSPAPQADSQAALTACQGAGGGGRAGVTSRGASVSAAFQSTGSALRAWQQDRGSASPIVEGHKDDAVVYVCYFDGQFTTPPSVRPPGAPPTSSPPLVPDRERVLVFANGEAAPDVVAPHQMLPLSRPGQGPSAPAPRPS